MYMFSAAGRESLGLLKNGGPCRQKKAPPIGGVEVRAWQLEKGTCPPKRGRLAACYSSMVRISASTSPRRLVKRAAAAPLITR